MSSFLRVPVVGYLITVDHGLFDVPGAQACRIEYEEEKDRWQVNAAGDSLMCFIRGENPHNSNVIRITGIARNGHSVSAEWIHVTV